MNKTFVRRSGALFVGLALLATACGSDDKTESTSAPTTTAAAAPTTEAAAPTTEAAPETTEATETTEAGTPGEAGALEGFKGTTPLVDLSQDFKDKLLAIDPDLKDFNYGAETYDAITLIALAVVQAKTDGIEYATRSTASLATVRSAPASPSACRWSRPVPTSTTTASPDH